MTVETDIEIRKQSNCGSTQASIFIFDKSDGSKRVFCSWVGDSRCCMYQYSGPDNKIISVEMSEDHKPELHREQHRIENMLPPDSTGYPIDVKLPESGRIGEIRVCAYISIHSIKSLHTYIHTPTLVLSHTSLHT